MRDIYKIQQKKHSKQTRMKITNYTCISFSFCACFSASSAIFFSRSAWSWVSSIVKFYTIFEIISILKSFYKYKWKLYLLSFDLQLAKIFVKILPVWLSITKLLQIYMKYNLNCIYLKLLLINRQFWRVYNTYLPKIHHWNWFLQHYRFIGVPPFW